MTEFKFKDTKYLSAVEKQKVLRQWEAFLKSGCHKDYFTQALYHHLTQHCSFIAHYDRAGFFATYFVEPEDTAHFLSQFDDRKESLRGRPSPISIEYGTSWTNGPDYEDINTAMCIVAQPYIPQLIAFGNAAQKDMDVARAKALLAKHGL